MGQTRQLNNVVVEAPAAVRQPAPQPISSVEHAELSWLRKAQAWGTPLFQSTHAGYSQAIARLRELEVKERAASASAFESRKCLAS
jgi:hypothetical protein